MKIYTWNINGYRAVLKKGFLDWLAGCDADVVGLQEIKAEPDQVEPGERRPHGWTTHWNPCRVKKGYSGTMNLWRREPLAVATGLPDGKFQGEGRCIRMEYEDFHLFNIYFPNGGMGPERLEYKLGYYDAFLAHAQDLRATKPIIVCGDFNTAHHAIDLKNPKANEEMSGFLPIERAWMDRFEAAGYVDCFRMFEPGPEHYTWWTYRFGARGRNAGWRIDYFFVSEELRGRVKRCWHEPQVMGSDHCPVGLEIETS